MISYLLGPRQQRRRWIAQRQYDAIRGYRRAICNHGEQRLFAAAPRDAPHLAKHFGEPHVGWRRSFRLKQPALQVVTVQGARQEVLGIGMGQGPLGETQKLQRILRSRG
jgi:hypothetical protein